MTTTQAQTMQVMNNNDLLIDGNIVKSVLSIYYPSWLYPTTKEDFVTEFGLFNALYSDGLKRQIDAMNLEYNPIDNYNKIQEDTTINGAINKTYINGEQSTQYVNGERITTNVNGILKKQTDNKISGYDSDSLVTDSQTIENTDAQTNTSNSNTYTDTENVSEHTNREQTDTVTNKFTSNIHGNVGVTRSQDMIRDEVELRKISVIHDYIAMFVKKSCYFVGGVS